MAHSRRLYSIAQIRVYDCACGKVKLAPISATEWERRKAGAWLHGSKMCESARYRDWGTGKRWDKKIGDYESA